MTITARRLRWTLPFVALAVSAPAAAQDTASGAAVPVAAGLVATQIRQQGFRCDEPSSATRDKDASTAEETVWVIGCDNATYRVKLIPDMAAQIEKID